MDLARSDGREFSGRLRFRRAESGARQQSRIFENATLKFPQLGAQPLAIESMTGFVSGVEFADGTLWIPTRGDLGSPQLRRVMAPSDERAAAGAIYRKKGLNALIAELNKF